MKLAHALAVSLSVVACGAPAGVDAPKDGMPFKAELLAAAHDFRTWDRVSDRAQWAPEDCWVPTPSGVLSSESEDEGTHGRKLYFLYAKDGALYDELSRWMRPSDDPDGFADLSRRMVGQVLVKESFTSVEVDPDTVPRRQHAALGERKLPSKFMLDGDRAFHTGEARALFVMLKLDPATPDTDEGWVYGTLTPDGSRVTAAGRIESCMECHVDTGRDRMFGHPRSRPLARQR